MPAYPTTGYMTAELCLNGHVITGDIENERKKHRNFAESAEPIPFEVVRNLVLNSEVIMYISAPSLV